MTMMQKYTSLVLWLVLLLLPTTTTTTTAQEVHQQNMGMGGGMGPSPTPAPIVPATAAPIVPATPAPVVPATMAPVVPATAAPVVPATAAPIVPATAAPIVPATAAPAPLPTMAPVPLNNDEFISLFDLVFQTKDEQNATDVDQAILVLAEAYNNVIARYLNEEEREMVGVALVETEILNPCMCCGTGRRQLQRLGRVRARVTASGRCSGCGSSAKFTNQVSGRSRGLSAYLLETATADRHLEDYLLFSQQQQPQDNSNNKNVRQRSQRRRAAGKGSSGKTTSGKGGGASNSVPAPAPTPANPAVPAPAEGVVPGQGYIIRNGPNGSTVVTSPNGEETIINGGGIGQGSGNSDTMPPGDTVVGPPDFVDDGSGTTGGGGGGTGGSSGQQQPIVGTIVNGGQLPESDPVVTTTPPPTNAPALPVENPDFADGGIGSGGGTGQLPLLDGLPSEEEVRMEYNNLIYLYYAQWSNVVGVELVDEL